MKKTILYTGIAVFCFSSCSKDFITLNPISQYSTDNFYKTASDINQAVNGAYQVLGTNDQYGDNFENFMEIASDNTFNDNTTQGGGERAAFDNFVVQPSNSILNSTWVSCYAGIQRCNVILNRIDAVSMADSTRNIRKGEVLFIRALTYFNLVRIWGDVPLVTNEVVNSFDAFKDKRVAAQDVYKQIVTDLIDAAHKLPATYDAIDKGRATRGAAQTLLAKVYLTQKNYTSASELLKAIIQTNTYALLSSFKTVFDPAGKNSAESIFEIQYLKNTASSGTSSSYDPTVLNQANNRPSPNMVSFFGSDPRLALSISYLGGTTPSNAYSIKRYDTKAADGSFGHNVIVLRYADVLLMLAETLNEIAYDPQAFSFLNLVRKRAGVSEYSPSNLPDQASFRTAVEKERRLELAFENHRWFDLLRTGKALTVLANTQGASALPFTIKASQLLFPIPQAQIDASAGLLTQN